jgi:hypothetical protein
MRLGKRFALTVEQVGRRKYRPAKRKPRTSVLDKVSRSQFGTGYLSHLESLGMIDRDSFIGKYNRNTLTNELADKISKVFGIETSDWYDGYKDRKPRKVKKKRKKLIKATPITPEAFDGIDFDYLDEIV